MYFGLSQSCLAFFMFCFLCTWFLSQLTKSKHMCSGFVVFSHFFNPNNFQVKKKNHWMSVNLNRIDIKKIVRLWCLPFLLPFALVCGSFLCFSRLTLVPMETTLVRSLPLSCSSKFALTLCHFFRDFPLI